MKKNFLRAFFCLNSKSAAWKVVHLENKGKRSMPVDFDLPDTGISFFFRLPERQGSSCPGDKLLCVQFADLVGREREREKETERNCGALESDFGCWKTWLPC